MREIKFRVYDKDLAKYLEGCEIDSLMAELSAEGDSRAVIIKQICPARYIFEQYTGLKDKNGKEIYEGDVVKAMWTDKYDYLKRSQFVESVSWDDEYACFQVGELGMKAYDTFEVIGNIHENPELLKEEK